MAIWGDFQGLTGVTGGGRGVKKLENWGDVIYGWSLTWTAFVLPAGFWENFLNKLYVKFEFTDQKVPT